jgi:FkbM family methyltransferase
MRVLHRWGSTLKNALMFALARLRGGYAMHGQDRWVLRVLNGKQGGFFVDLGAYDGITGSDTLLLERSHNWNGICIEADPSTFTKLKAARRCTCVDACVDGTERETDFLQGAGLYNGIVGYFPAGHDEQLAHYMQLDDAKPVPRHTRTLESILREHHAPQVIDYLSLDTEGSEAAILETFPFDVYRILTITVEHNARPEYRERLRTLLLGIGYKLDRESSRDDFFVHGSLA